MEKYYLSKLNKELTRKEILEMERKILIERDFLLNITAFNNDFRQARKKGGNSAKIFLDTAKKESVYHEINITDDTELTFEIVLKNEYREVKELAEQLRRAIK